MASSSLQEIIACVGHPVGGNPTQFVMERAFEAAGVDSRCLTLDVPPENLAASIEGMAAMGFRGAILAEPHQRPACQYVSRLDAAAEMLGEIDLIYRDGDALVGDHSTVRAITELVTRHTDLRGKRVVVLGAGSAARAGALAVGLAAAEQITIVARDDSAAERVGTLLERHASGHVQAQAWLDLYRFPVNTDIVIQATSAGSVDRGQRPLSIDYECLSSELLLIDTVFNPPRTEFLRRGEQAGCTTVDGLELLVQRAAVAFQIWTGVEPDWAVLRDAFEEFLMI